MDNIYEPDWLKSAMDEASIRTGELAEVSGVSRSQIQRIRNGSPPRYDTLCSIRGALQKLQQDRAA